MANLSKDIQCAGSDTRPPMLDRTNFASWQQCIRLYCRGKENGVNILKSIDEGPFQMELSETQPHPTPPPPQPQKNRGQGNNAQGGGAAGYGGAQNRVGNANPGQARQIKCYNCNGIGHIPRNCTQPKRRHNSKYFKDKMLLMQAQENGVALDEEQLLFITGGQDNAIDEDVDEQPVQDLALNVNNVFQADDCDAFDSDVDEAPMAQTMFMANLSFTDPVYDEVGPSYDSDILSEVHDHDHYQDVVCEHHEEHELHDDVQPNYVVDSHANYTSDSNMIPYDQYVKDNAVPVVQSNVSSVTNDAYIMIFNDMHEPHAQSVSDTTRNTVVDNSLTAELATYKEQVELYERRARFKLKEREQKIDEQLRIKENKYLEEFLDMKALKEKVEDKLYKQEQSLQTVHMLCKPKPYYNEQNKVAIGYKNPLCLTRAKQVQSALYNGYEIIKNNHVSALVHNTEDTLEIAEITRRKMKDPECVTHKVKIALPDYSKENYLATFTPQKQLTPEQIFWSQDLIKMKEEALKKQTIASRLIKALTVYPPNKSATFVPRVLPTKSQVKINIFTLIQLFSEFEKTYKKRTTPTGITERESGFEQTKECYLTEVIPFFKTLKEHFEGIQKALTKEIKEMKDIFAELEAEVDQNVVNRKHDEIERKNILIANDNLIVDCLSKEVFYIATNSELIVSRFTKMHEAHTIVQTRCLELEAGLSKLQNKITQLTEKIFVLQEQNELFKAENEKVKQHYKELYDSIKITRAKHIEQTTALLTENENLKAQIHVKLKCNTMESVKPRVLALGRYAIDVEPIPLRNRNNREVHLHYLKHLKESVETIREIVKEAKIGTCPKAFNQQDKNHAPTPVIRKKQVTFEEQCDMSNSNTHKHVEQLNTRKTNVRVPPSTGVNCCTNASGSQPRSNTKKNRISPAKGVNKKKVEEHPRINKSNLRTTNRVDSSSSSKRTASPSIHNIHNVVRKVRNFMKKFIGTVRFGNDHFGAIMGYGDYVIGDSVISRVYYVEGLGHNLFSVGQFCDSDLEVAIRKHSCYVRDTDSVDLTKGSRGSNLSMILKASSLQAKTTINLQLEESIKCEEASNEAKLKKEINVLETINFKLESSVAKLLVENEKLNKENEHLKQTYKELCDSIKRRIQTKDHNDSLIAQVNSKTVENADLKHNSRKGFGLPKLNVINFFASKHVTPHYLPKVREYVLAKPHHMIASCSSRNSQERNYVQMKRSIISLSRGSEEKDTKKE
ncbi:integrase, catalytic region, zinc finger, CCHC-type containing protein [Tanacetum coccineum]